MSDHAERPPKAAEPPKRPAPPRSRARRLRRIAVVVALALLLPVLGAGIALRLEYAGDPGAAGRTRGRDAVWLGHAWVDGRRDAADLAALLREVRGTGIRDLYVHTGPLEHDGSLDPGLYPDAGRLIAELHRALPGVRVQAWLGDIVSHGGSPGVRTGDPATRSRIRDSAEQVLGAGFDGVHFDLEPVHSGDAGFVALLRDTHRLTAARGAPLSVATHQIEPLPSLHSVASKYWSQSYFAEVARAVDQVAVMAYDSWMPLEGLFGGSVAHQTALALEVTPPGVDLLIGLPAYHTSTPGHHPSAETVAAAVCGARLGLARHARDRERFGLAMYVDFAASTEDWAVYRSSWGKV
jgi:hypothetical protein